MVIHYRKLARVEQEDIITFFDRLRKRTLKKIKIMRKMKLIKTLIN